MNTILTHPNSLYLPLALGCPRCHEQSMDKLELLSTDDMAVQCAHCHSVYHLVKVGNLVQAHVVN